LIADTVLNFSSPMLQPITRSDPRVRPRYCVTETGLILLVHRWLNLTFLFFTLRCYAERGIATASRPSVPPSVTLRYRGHNNFVADLPMGVHSLQITFTTLRIYSEGFIAALCCYLYSSFTFASVSTEEPCDEDSYAPSTQAWNSFTRDKVLRHGGPWNFYTDNRKLCNVRYCRSEQIWLMNPTRPSEVKAQISS